jgi:hypothetical protein
MHIRKVSNDIENLITDFIRDCFYWFYWQSETFHKESVGFYEFIRGRFAA